MKTIKYTCDGFRAVYLEEPDGMKEAAEIFAGRLERNQYGPLGNVGALRLVRRPPDWSDDGAMGIFEAFIGRKNTKEQNTTGSNVRFTVYREEIG